jgi:hypothetical protein
MSVVCTRDLVASSRISEIIAGVVKISSAELMIVDIDTAFLMSGPVSRIRECMGFWGAPVSILKALCAVRSRGGKARKWMRSSSAKD